jgi:hypothetical protein
MQYNTQLISSLFNMTLKWLSNSMIYTGGVSLQDLAECLSVETLCLLLNIEAHSKNDC